MNAVKIYKSNINDHDAELRFELEFLASLSVDERFEMMIRRSNEIKDMLIKNGHRRPVEIVKRS
jgi:hypothetical protein